LYETAIKIIKSEKKASTSFLQRKLQIGYNRAARIIDKMEEKGLVSKANHVGKREVL
jgi:DNA segregation ATPase FtsK/SpoIIIE and related proteins